MGNSNENARLWKHLIAGLGSINQILQSIKTVQTSSVSLANSVRNYVEDYFYNNRPVIVSFGIDINVLDSMMQNLLRLVSSKSSVSKYRRIVKDIKAELISLEMSSIISLSEEVKDSKKFAQSDIEGRIVEILKQIAPAVALSYLQVLDDLNSKTRISYRGTAGEIREVLREVLDILAPDKDVEQAVGFKYEKDPNSSKPLPTPTMKQKVRFILKSRGKSSGVIKAPEDAVAVIEESVAAFARSTYARGSTSAHTEEGIEKSEARQVKMYVDTVLCELLAIVL